jgi:hypothetical protein
MSVSAEDRDRIRAAEAEAHHVGFRLYVDEAPNALGKVTHMAMAAPHDGGRPTLIRFLTYSTSAADAAEGGLDVLRGVLERGDPWPEP